MENEVDGEEVPTKYLCFLEYDREKATQIQFMIMCSWNLYF